MMRKKRGQGLFKKIVTWLLGIVTVLYIVSGFGITEFRTVNTLTFGLLTKNLAFKTHDSLWIPFIVLLTLHLTLPLVFKWKNGKDACK